MAPSDVDVIDPIASWLQDGAYVLELWLACGVSAPTPAATSALHNWLAAAETAGFHDITERAQSLLSDDTASSGKAEALLDLMVWQVSLQRAYTAEQLRLHYASP